METNVTERHFTTKELADRIYFSTLPVLSALSFSVALMPILTLTGSPNLSDMARFRYSKTSCHICGFPIRAGVGQYHPLYLNMDHLIAFADGGKGKDNLRPSHRVCNLMRGRREITGSLISQCQDRVKREMGQ